MPRLKIVSMEAKCLQGLDFPSYSSALAELADRASLLKRSENGVYEVSSKGRVLVEATLYYYSR